MFHGKRHGAPAEVFSARPRSGMVLGTSIRDTNRD